MNSFCSMASTPSWHANTSVYSLKSGQPEISASAATWKRESDQSTRGRGDIAVNGFANQEHHSDMQDFNCNNSSSTYKDSNGCEMEKEESVAVDSHNLACVHDNPFFRRLGLKHQHKHESGHERGEKRFSRQLSDSDREPKSFNDDDVVEYKPGSGFVHKLMDKFSSLGAREESSAHALKEKRSLSLENLADDEKPLRNIEKRGAAAQHGDHLNHRAISVENLNHKPLSLRSVSYTSSDHSSHKKPRSPRDVYPDVSFAREDIIIIEQPAVPQRGAARRDSSSDRHNAIEIVSLREDVDKEDELPKPNTVNTVRSMFEKSLQGSSKRRNLSTSSISSDSSTSLRVHGSVAAKSASSSVIQRELDSVSTHRESSPVNDSTDVALRSLHGPEVSKTTEQRNSADISSICSPPKKPEPVRRASSSDILSTDKPQVPSGTKPQVGKKVLPGSATSQIKEQKGEAESTQLIFSSESLLPTKTTRKEKRAAPPVPSVPPVGAPQVTVPRNAHKEREKTPELLMPRDRGSGRLPGLLGSKSAEIPAPKPNSEAPVIPPRNDVKPEVFSSSDIAPPAPSPVEAVKETEPAVTVIFGSQDIPTPAETVSTSRETISPPKEVSTPQDPPQSNGSTKEAVSIPKKPSREEKENRFIKPQKPPTPRISHEKVDNSVKLEPVTNSVSSSSSSSPPPVNNHSSSEDAPIIKGVPTIVALRMQKSKDPSAAPDIASSDAFGVSLKPSKRAAPSPSGSATSSSSTPASSQNSSETDDTEGGNLFRKKLKPRDMNTGVAMVFDSSQVDRKPETVVPRLDLSGLDEPDKPNHGYQEGYRPTKIKPCKIHFEGANVLLGKSSLRKKPRASKGVITFADNLHKLFEYPSEQSQLEEYLVSHPGEEEEIVFLAADVGESTDDAEDEELETPRGGKGGLLDKEPESAFKSNTSLSHSVGFSSYQPKNVMEYEFGAALKEPEPPKVAPQQAPPPDPSNMELLPADEVDSWSEATTSDLLF